LIEKAVEDDNVWYTIVCDTQYIIFTTVK
jgi:hypothetical protein